jgi:hypothetical protein
MTDQAETPKIESGIPMPLVKRRADGVGRILALANVGDSIFLPGRAASPQGSFALFGNGWWAARKVDGGYRVWKIAEPPRPPRAA